MSTFTPRRHPSPPSLVMAAVLAMIAGLLGVSSTASAAPGGPGEPGEPGDPPPEIVITITDKVVPVYGDPLTFGVKAGGSGNVVYVYDGTQVLVGPVSMRTGQIVRVSIPTLGRYPAGVAQKLRVEVLNDDAMFGNVDVSFTPRHIPSQVNLSGTTVPYGSPVYGRLDPTVATAVAPSGGTMAMRRGTLVRARYGIRTDGTFALNETGLVPGTYKDVAFYYEGDASYAANAAGSGMVVTDLTVTTMPTTTRASLTADTVEQGEVLEVVASTVPTRSDSAIDVQGVMEVHAAPIGETEFTEVARADYPGGGRDVRIDLSAWAATHPGAWTIRTVNHGSAFIDGSASDSTLQVVPEAAPIKDTATTLTLSSSSATVHGSVQATAQVTTAAGVVDAGSVVFSVDGRTIATVPVGPDGRARTSVAAPRVGGARVLASYAGTASYAASASAAQTLTGLRATSATGLTLKKRTGRTAKVTVAVTSVLRAAGTVQVLRGKKVVATGLLVEAKGGRLTIKVRGLRPGVNRLTARFLGSATILASASRVLKVRIPR